MNNVDQSGCGCCEGIEVQTPAQIYNAPGLAAIAYRVGTYAQFKHSLQVRLSDSTLPGLSGLKTRNDDDFSIALLDSWAMVADVLTFYQERIANESYKRTATEKVSLLELARLVKYELQPGVAADTYLAFTLEEAVGSPGRTIIDIGTKVQSLPNPGEQPQTFETSEKIEARAVWNAMKPPLMKLQPLSPDMPEVILKGLNANLRQGDALLIVVQKGDGAGKATFVKVLRRVSSVKVDALKQQTTVFLEPREALPTATQGQPVGATAGGQIPLPVTPGASPPAQLASVTLAARKAEAAQPLASFFRQSQELNNETIKQILRQPDLAQRDLESLAVVQGWSTQQLFATIAAQSQSPASTNGTQHLLGGQAPGTGTVSGVYALRMHGSLFGHNAPDWKLMPDIVQNNYIAAAEDRASDLAAIKGRDPNNSNRWIEWPFFPPPARQLDLDLIYNQLQKGSWIVVEHPGMEPAIVQATAVTETAVSDYSLSGKITQLILDSDIPQPANFGELRQTTVFGQSELLPLADLVDTEPIQDQTIVVNGLYYGLKPGQRLVVSGERDNATDVQTSEFPLLAEAMLSSSGLTKLTLKGNLTYTYKRDSVTVNANVVKATQGESIQNEVLGSGDASQPFQHFMLRQSPLTYVQAATQTGKASTLNIFVNGMQWDEVDSFFGHGSREHIFVTHIGDDGKVTVQFGDGRTGARLPTGEDNVVANYRTGAGSQGMVRIGQLSLLKTRPLGVKAVTNPLAPSGAIDPETTDDARRNADNTVRTLGRIVSAADYEDFARSYAAVAKAKATVIWNNTMRIVFVTVAGPSTATDPTGTEIVQDTAIYNKIIAGMRRASEPTISFSLQSYIPRVFRIAARVKVNPNHAQSEVLQAVEQSLLLHFSFDARSFAQEVTLKEVVAVIQAVPGVVMVEIRTFYRLDASKLAAGELDINAEFDENVTLAAALPTIQEDGTVSLAELLLIDPQHPFDSLEVIP